MATSGAPKDLDIPTCNLVDFVFSNPFTKSTTIKSVQESNHFIPPIPLDKKILKDPQGKFVTWEKLRADVQRFAFGLRDFLKLDPQPVKGLTPTHGQKAIISPIILIYLPNCLCYSTIQLGSLAAGYTVTPANPFLTAPEIAHILSLSKPIAIFTQPGAQGRGVIQDALKLVNVDYQIDDSHIFTVDVDNDSYGSIDEKESLNLIEKNDWKQLLHPSKQLEPMKLSGQENAKRAAFIIWSSGTSGKSKGVVLSHKAFITNMLQVWPGMPIFDTKEVIIGAIPGFHILGLCNIFLPCAAMGFTVVIMKKFEPEQFFKLNSIHKATRLIIAPPIAVLLAKSPIVSKYDLSSIKSIVSGGAPLGPEVIEAVYKRLGLLVKMGYGLTECGGVTAVDANTWDELSPLLGSSGSPIDSVELKIISTDGEGKQCTFGESGEILIRTPGAMIEYLLNKEATDETMDSDGWYHTGDVGHISNNGLLYITDRLKEIIKVKGFQVSPAELEDYICGHSQVADAGVTSVFSNEAQTEYPYAYIVPKDPKLLSQVSQGVATEELLELAQNVAKLVESKVVHYKRLQGGIKFIKEVPKNPTGKILRRFLKDTKGIHVDIYNKQIRSKL